jgi:DNA-binding winged helix-turn-helix (wHTH) protein/TolB-like protein
MVLCFAGFELDRPRAELRGPNGEAIKLRPKTFAMLELFAANAGRVLTKQELMDAVWPNVHVGDDSLFQCIKEIRTALGDDQRQLIKLVSGRGYLFDAEVAVEPAAEASIIPSHVPLPPADAGLAGPATPPRLLGLRRGATIGIAGLGALLGLAVVVTMWAPGLIFGRAPPVMAVMPIAAAGGDGEVAPMAANVTSRLADGLAKIDNIRVATPQAADATRADFVVSGELQKREGTWELRARMTRATTGEILWSEPVSVALEDADVPLQQSRSPPASVMPWRCASTRCSMPRRMRLSPKPARRATPRW